MSNSNYRRTGRTVNQLLDEVFLTKVCHAEGGYSYDIDLDGYAKENSYQFVVLVKTKNLSTFFSKENGEIFSSVRYFQCYGEDSYVSLKKNMVKWKRRTLKEFFNVPTLLPVELEKRRLKRAIPQTQQEKPMRKRI